MRQALGFLLRILYEILLWMIVTTVSAVLIAYGYDPDWFLTNIFGPDVAAALLNGSLRFATGDVVRTIILVVGLAAMLGLVYYHAIRPKIRDLKKSNRTLSSTSTSPQFTLPVWTEAAIDRQFLDRTFRNEQVTLDKSRYINCKFANVTFVYRGEGPWMLTNCSIEGTKAVLCPRPDLDALLRFLMAIDMFRGTKADTVPGDQVKR
jgi:hypothetical protein